MTEHLTDVDMASDAELLKLIRALGPVGEKAAQWIETLGGAYDKAFQQALENGQAAQEANALLNSEWFARVTYKQQLRAALEQLEQLEGACPNCKQWVVLKPSETTGEGQ